MTTLQASFQKVNRRMEEYVEVIYLLHLRRAESNYEGKRLEVDSARQELIELYERGCDIEDKEYVKKMERIKLKLATAEEEFEQVKDEARFHKWLETRKRKVSAAIVKFGARLATSSLPATVTISSMFSLKTAHQLRAQGYGEDRLVFEQGTRNLGSARILKRFHKLKRRLKLIVKPKRQAQKAEKENPNEESRVEEGEGEAVAVAEVREEGEAVAGEEGEAVAEEMELDECRLEEDKKKKDKKKKKKDKKKKKEEGGKKAEAGPAEEEEKETDGSSLEEQKKKKEKKKNKKKNKREEEAGEEN